MLRILVIRLIGKQRCKLGQADLVLTLSYSNIYGQHPFYLDTRYYKVDKHGSHTLVKTDKADASEEYVSYSHGVFLRNAHGQEVLLNPKGVTWRTLGGSIDLTFYAGPSQVQVTQQYLKSTIGLPAMQKYSTLGFHQCRWGYNNWTELADVVANFEKFEIPLEYIWYVVDASSLGLLV